MKNALKLQKTAQFSVLLLLATMPLLFGAVHPIVVGTYAVFILLGCGGWLLLNCKELPDQLFKSGWIIPILFFIGWIVFTTVPLPLSLLDIVTPTRASSLHSVNQLADTDIRWAPLSYNSSASLMTAIFLFALLLYALTLQVLLDADSSFLKKVIYTCIGMGILQAAYGMLQVFTPHMGVLWLQSIAAGKGMARGTIIYKNQYASLLNMCWPLAIGAALLRFKAIGTTDHGNEGHWRKRRNVLLEKFSSKAMQGLLFLFTASFIMMTVLFSQSRGGIITMGLIMAFLLFALPLTRKNKILLTSCVFLLTIVYGSAVGFTSIINRFLTIQGSGLARLDIWLGSLPMLYDHLLTGIGLNSYALLSPIYLKHFPEHLLFDRVHNEYLEITIELGVPVAVFFFSTIFIALFLQVKQFWQQKRKKISNIESAQIIALLAYSGVAGFLFHGIADFGWRLPANLLYVVTLIALVKHGINKSRGNLT